MNVTDPERLAALARLARLELAPGEAERLAPELERILEAFAVLAGRSPAAPAAPDELSATTIVATGEHRRGDEPQPSLARERLLSAAPEHSAGFYAVPKTVGSDG